jgi:putative cardiolipin synthase
MVIDGRKAWVGSFNMDPRSARLNTEVGMMVESASFAAELAGQITADVAPAHAWRLALEPEPGGEARIVWHGTRDGRPVRFDADPDVGWWRLFQQALYRSLPGIEEVL